MSRAAKLSTGGMRQVRFIFLVWLIVTGVGTAFPHLRLWGFHLPAFLPTWLQAVFFGTAGAVALFPPRWSAGIHRSTALISKFIHSPFSALFLLAAFIIFRASTGLLGDGILRGRETDIGMYNPLEILPSILASSIFELGHQSFGWGGQDALAATSILAGCAFLLIIWFFPRRIWTKTDERHIARFFIIAGGATALFFGYVESYAFAAAAIFGFLLSAEAFRRRKSPFLIIAIFFLAAVASHISMLVLYPALLALAMSGKKRRWRLLTVGAIGIAVLGWAYWVFQSSNVAQETSWGSLLIPLTSTPPVNYGLFSVAHLLDILNLLCLVVPGALIALPFTRPRRFTKRDVAKNAFWIAAVFLPLGMLLLMDPKLGMARDWDLFALSVIPFLAWASVRLADSRSERPVGSLSLPLFAGISVLAMFVGLNARTETSIARYTALLDVDPVRSAYGHEIMAMKYRDMGDTDAEIRHWQKALAQGDHPRYLTNLAAAYLRVGDAQNAYHAARRAFDSNPSYAYAAYYLGAAYDEFNMLDSAYVYYAHAVFLDPNHAGMQFDLGMTLLRRGQVDDARGHLEAAIRLDSTDENYHNGLAGLLLDAGEFAEAEAAVTRALQINPRHAHSRVNLALIYMRTGRSRQALEELTTVLSYPELGVEQRAYLTQLYAQIRANMTAPGAAGGDDSPSP